eukprot:g1350.t1
MTKTNINIYQARSSEEAIPILYGAMIFVALSNYIISPVRFQIGAKYLSQDIVQLSHCVNAVAFVLAPALPFRTRRSDSIVDGIRYVFLFFTVAYFLTLSCLIFPLFSENYVLMTLRCFYIVAALQPIFSVSLLFTAAADYASSRKKKEIAPLVDALNLGSVAGSLFVVALACLFAERQVGVEDSGHAIRLSLGLGAALTYLSQQTLGRLPAIQVVARRQHSSSITSWASSIRSVATSRTLVVICVFNLMYAMTNTMLDIDRTRATAASVTSSESNAEHYFWHMTASAEYAVWNLICSAGVYVVQLVATKTHVARNIDTRIALSLMPMVTMIGMSESKRANHLRDVLSFLSYEEYLDSRIKSIDEFYLEDKELARELVQLGYRGSDDTVSREEFEKIKRDARNKKSEKMSKTNNLVHVGIDLSSDPFLRQLAHREELVRNGKLSSIIFIRDRNQKGHEVSGYIDYAFRLKTEDFTPYFQQRKRLMPRPSDLSYYNWKTQKSTSNSNTNFQVIATNEAGLLFKNKKDRKVINVDASADVGDNSTRTEISTGSYLQVVIYDHMTRRKN